MSRRIASGLAIGIYCLLLVASYFIIKDNVVTKDESLRWEMMVHACFPMGNTGKLFDVCFNNEDVKLVKGELFAVPHGLKPKDEYEWHKTNDNIRDVYELVPKYEGDKEWSGWCFHVLEEHLQKDYYDYFLYPIAIGVKKGVDGFSESTLKKALKNYYNALVSDATFWQHDDENEILYKDLTSLFYNNKYYRFFSAKNYYRYELKEQVPTDLIAFLRDVNKTNFLGQYHSISFNLPASFERMNNKGYYLTLEDPYTVLYLYRQDADVWTTMYRHYEKPMEKEFTWKCVITAFLLTMALLISLRIIKRKQKQS